MNSDAIIKNMNVDVYFLAQDDDFLVISTVSDVEVISYNLLI